MKRILLLMLLCSSFSGKAQNLSKIFKLTDIQLDSIVRMYKWENQDFLILNFHHKSENCFYDNNANIKASIKWKKNFYKDIETSKILNITVYSDQKKAKEFIDNKKYFGDKKDIIYYTFFPTKEDCCGVMIVNKNGYYQRIFGEYLIEEVTGILKTLNTL